MTSVLCASIHCQTFIKKIFNFYINKKQNSNSKINFQCFEFKTWNKKVPIEIGSLDRRDGYWRVCSHRALETIIIYFLNVHRFYSFKKIKSRIHLQIINYIVCYIIKEIIIIYMYIYNNTIMNKKKTAAIGSFP